MNRESKKEDTHDMEDRIERECIKIHAVCDVVSTVDVCELERDTLAALMCIIRETAGGIVDSLMSLTRAVNSDANSRKEEK